MYNIQFKRQTAKLFSRIDKHIKKQYIEKIHYLQTDPYNKESKLDIKAMQGKKNAFRWRIWKYRIIYSIFGKEILVLIIKIDTRGGVYKK